MYYVARVKYLTDGTEKKSELMSYSSLQSAMAKYHSNLGTDMVDSTLSGGVVIVFDKNGHVHASEAWTAESED